MLTLTLVLTGAALLRLHVWDVERREDRDFAQRMREAAVEREWEALALESAAAYSPRCCDSNWCTGHRDPGCYQRRNRK